MSIVIQCPRCKYRVEVDNEADIRLEECHECGNSKGFKVVRSNPIKTSRKHKDSEYEPKYY